MSKRRITAYESKLFCCARHIIPSVCSRILLKHYSAILMDALGRCYSEEVIREYMRFCSRNGLHLISDEIYALSVWDNPCLPDATPFTSVLSINLEEVIDPSMVHVVWGLSKVRSHLHLVDMNIDVF